MTSEQLMRQRREYQRFEEIVGEILDNNRKAFDEIENSERLVRECLAYDDCYIEEYTYKTIIMIKETAQSFKEILSDIDSKISSLNRQIARARDREMAERLSASGN